MGCRQAPQAASIQKVGALSNHLLHYSTSAVTSQRDRHLTGKEVAGTEGSKGTLTL